MGPRYCDCRFPDCSVMVAKAVEKNHWVRLNIVFKVILIFSLTNKILKIRSGSSLPSPPALGSFGKTDHRSGRSSFSS